jgi:3-oxoacyl-[acyl-carrier-protein] synthase II
MSERAVITGFSSLSAIGSVDQDYHDFITGQRPPPQPRSDFECFNLETWPFQKAFSLRGYDPHPQKRLLDIYSDLSRNALVQAQLGSMPPVILGLGVGALCAQDIVDRIKEFDFRLDPQFHTLDDYLKNNPGSVQHPLIHGHRSKLSIISTACTSGAQALGIATRMVRRGECTRVLCGAVDTFADLVYAGFCILDVMSRTASCRPFDKNRDGFVAGEGGAMFVVESLESAKARSAGIYAEIIGYGESNNAYRVTDLPEDGEGAFLSMHRAILDADLKDPIDYVNAHGTGTRKNDSIEIKAIDRIAHGLGYKVKVSSTKGAHGHLIAAAGAIEAAMCLHSLSASCLPLSTGLESAELELPNIHYIQEPDRSSTVNTILSNSFGFGGSNASILFGRYKP